MKITLKQLEDLGADSEIVNYFKQHHGEEAEIETVLAGIIERKAPFAPWLFKRFKLSGLAQLWRENGQLEYSYNYKDGKLID